MTDSQCRTQSSLPLQALKCATALLDRARWGPVREMGPFVYRCIMFELYDYSGTSASGKTEGAEAPAKKRKRSAADSALVEQPRSLSVGLLPFMSLPSSLDHVYSSALQSQDVCPESANAKALPFFQASQSTPKAVLRRKAEAEISAFRLSESIARVRVTTTQSNNLQMVPS